MAGPDSMQTPPDSRAPALPDRQAVAADESACGQGSPASDPQILVLDGWPSRQLGGLRSRWMLVMSLCYNSLIAISLKELLLLWNVHVLSHVPDLFLIAVVWSVFLVLAWPARWPAIPGNVVPTCHLHFSAAGFAISSASSHAEWQSWSTVTRVSIRRTLRADLSRIRLVQVETGPERTDQGVDLVVACQSGMIGQVRRYVAACREGRLVVPPSLPSTYLAAWTTARRSVRSNGLEEGDLRFTQCPQCGYDLIGLPDKGQCPECGFAYDSQRLIVLYGSRARAREPLTRARLLCLFGMLIASVIGMYMLIAAPRWVIYAFNPFWLLLLLAMTRFMHVHGGSRSAGSRFGACQTAQLRLSPEGFGLRVGYGPCPLKPWSDRTWLHIDPVEGQTYRIRITSTPVPKSCTLLASLDFSGHAQAVVQLRETVTEWQQSKRRLAEQQ